MEMKKSFSNPGCRPFEKRIYLSSPTMHGEELAFIQQAFDANWVSTIGENIDRVEAQMEDFTGKPFAVAIGSGTAALHMAIRACAVKMYGMPRHPASSLEGKRVFCSDLTFAASVNPILYEGGEPVLIDSDYETWNMDPEALERAFQIYPDVKLVVLVHLYGTPAKLDQILEICRRHGALLVEDAAESLGASYRGKQTGSFGDISVISFNGNKIITGSCGGVLLCDNEETMRQVRKWSTQSREPAAWYQHKELGYNYRMSNLVAGVIRGQFPWLADHIERKRHIYEVYREGLKGLPLTMNPYDSDTSMPNHWLSCVLIDREAMCQQIRTDSTATYVAEAGKSCPTRILEELAALNAEGRPIWKPIHLQPIYARFPYITAGINSDVSTDLFVRGLCLPSDIKMTDDQIAQIIAAVWRSF